MRRIVGVLACLSISAVSVALADPPASSAPAAAQPADSTPAAASAQSSAPATATTAAEAPKPDVDAQEKHFLAEGYKIEMHNGEKLFCRREEQMGTRLGATKTCATAQQLTVTEQQTKQGLERYQGYQTGPSSK
jgi:hypothetical protein